MQQLIAKGHHGPEDNRDISRLSRECGVFPVRFPADVSGNIPKMEDIGTRIAARIKELNTSASAVSTASGYGRDYIRDLIRGKKTQISAEAAVRIAEALQCSVNWLLHGDGSPEDVPDERAEEPQGVRFGGIVEAGAFRAMDLF